MSLFLDYVSLSPTRHEIEVPGARREWIDVDGGQAEAFLHQHRPEGGPAHLTILKFVGAGGRAENLTPHPLEHWGDVAADVWSINPPGFGNSRGRAGMATIVPTALALHDHVVRKDNELPILLMGTSLGAATAMAVASRRPASALLVRDTPQLARVIEQRFGWWTLGLANLSARQVPESLDTFAAAEKCHVPALMITSGRDRIVPLTIQQNVVDAYAGTRRVVHFPNADHGQPPEQQDVPHYLEALGWLRSHLGV